MRGVGAVFVAAVAAMTLAGCGSSDPSSAKGSGASAVPADKGALTVGAVQQDVRAAADAGGLPHLEFADKASLPGGRCKTLGQTGGSDREAVERTVGELKKRGWTVSGQLDDGGGAGWELHRAGWTLSVLTGTGGPSDKVLASPSGDRSGAGRSAGASFLGFAKTC